MRLRPRFIVIVFALLLLAAGAACAPAPETPVALASFTENYVEVVITLERNPAGNAFLCGTFTPAEGHHLYSKDIPVNGLEGLGRPTLLELTAGSRMIALGGLTESTQAQEPDFEPKELLVYPAGPVTLRLPVELPPGDAWVDDEIKITYMACSEYQCKPPVEGRIVSIRIPGAEVFANQ